MKNIVEEIMKLFSGNGNKPDIKIKKPNKIVIIALVLLLSVVYYYFSLFPFSYHYGYVLVIFYLVVTFIANFIFLKKPIQKAAFTFFVSFLLMLYYIVPTPFMFANNYAHLIENKHPMIEKQYDDSISKMLEFNKNQLYVVDKQYAYKIADKVIGEKELGSQYKMGNLELVSYFDKKDKTNKLVWVAPLEPSDIFKYFSTKFTSNAYVLVDATDPNKPARLMTENFNGEKINIHFFHDSFFFSGIERYTRTKDIWNGLKDYSFEIDDDGNPYYVVSAMTNRIGLYGEDVVGVHVINANSGKDNYYQTDKTPSWVDRVYPIDTIREQISNWGLYSNGFWNSMFAQKGIRKLSSDQLSYVYINGDCYYFIGITSSGQDNSLLGIMLIDTKKKTPLFIKTSGATEAQAQKSAEGKVQNFKYSASAPLILSINNKPYYFMTLKDDSGLIKKYALVNVKEYQNVMIFDSVDEIINAENITQGSKGSTTSDKDKIKEEIKQLINQLNDKVNKL